jgi:hypothetical protein
MIPSLSSFPTLLSYLYSYILSDYTFEFGIRLDQVEPVTGNGTAGNRNFPGNRKYVTGSVPPPGNKWAPPPGIDILAWGRG